MSSIAVADSLARLLLPVQRAWFHLTERQDDPLVSVTIATFNRADLLVDRTLPPILAQTHANLEIIVVGDGCSDDTGERLDAFRDTRIRWENRKQRGTYPDDPFHRWLVAGTPAANRAIQLARGRWIAWCDDDDVWSEDHVELLLTHARSTGAEAIYGAMMFQRSADEWLRIGGMPPRPGNVPHSSIMYRRYLRSFRYDIGAWRTRTGGDAHRWGRMYRSGVRFAYLDHVISSSPLRPGQTIRGQQAAIQASLSHTQ